MPTMKSLSSAFACALIAVSWLITGCQAPPMQYPEPVVLMPEAEVPPPSPVSPPPENLVFEPPSTPAAAPDPAGDAELDRKIARSYLDAARQNKPNAVSKNPAVVSALIQRGVSELRSNQTAAAKATLMQAQTLSPNNPTVYLYLSEVAIRENKPAEAQGLAQRGLLFSGSSQLTRGLWKMIQISAQMQGNSTLANQAAIKANQS